MRPRILSRQRGVAAVEFALISALFFSVLFGIVEMGRVLFYMNTAAEATRLGARLAVVCDVDDTAVKARMTQMLNILTPERIDVIYEPAGCTKDTCLTVTVRIAQGQNGLTVNTLIPFLPFTVDMPPFATTLTRESLDSANNAVCT